MAIEINGEIKEIVEALRKVGKNSLAGCIEDNWQKNALEYSRELNSYSPLMPLEPEMRAAFKKELERLEVKNVEKILDNIEKRRVIQTAPHLVATEGPRMLTINWLGSLGVPDDEYYIVGMYSGIPFSNSFRPGRINRKDGQVNLFPSSMQDDLVFRSKIPEKLLEVVKTLPAELKKLLPEAKVGESYTRWALQVCGNIERGILGKENLVYLDINEVIANYFEEIKDNSEHPMHKIKELEAENLFFAFAPLLLNHFKCFGSFRQVEYLPEYQRTLSQLAFLKEFEIEKVPTANLTTGEFVNKSYPVDIILGEVWKPDPQILLGDLLLPMKDRLLES